MQGMYAIEWSTWYSACRFQPLMLDLKWNLLLGQSMCATGRGTRDNALRAGPALSLISAGYFIRLPCLILRLLLVGGVQKCCSPATQHADLGLRAVVTDQHVNGHSVVWLQGK